MKRLVVACIMGFASMVLSSLAVSAQGTGSAQLAEIDSSGIQARVVFLDSGSRQNGLVVSGVATGLDPNQFYISLLYDTGSTAEGPAACLPTGPGITPGQMIVGLWRVAANGTGTLFAIKNGDSYVPLRNVGTMSIRVVLGPAPQGAVLEACGRVRRR
jgi:hypothetical protein